MKEIIIKKHTEEITNVIRFLERIGINIIEKELTEDTFLPGLTLASDGIVVDFEKLKYPGDILHEAGHIAVTSPENRKRIGTDEIDPNWPDGGEEMGAILWSYAAAVHLNLPLDFIFHPNGYKNSSDWLIESFQNENYVGLPFLEWIGLTLGNEKALENSKEAFPVMQKWIRE